MALVAAFAFVFQARAKEQPNLVNPSASVKTEKQLLDELHRIQGRGSIPDVRSYVIEQPAGREWRIFHEGYLHWSGGMAIVGILCLRIRFYLWRWTRHFV